MKANKTPSTPKTRAEVAEVASERGMGGIGTLVSTCDILGSSKVSKEGLQEVVLRVSKEAE